MSSLLLTDPVPAQIDTWARGIIPLTTDISLVDRPIDRLLCKSTSSLQSSNSTQSKYVLVCCVSLCFNGVMYFADSWTGLADSWTELEIAFK